MATHYYGGQAIIEGVMIRGESFSSVAVRRSDNEIIVRSDPINPIYNGRLRRVPMIRGVVVLIETLVLGMRSLTYSANVAIGEQGDELPKVPIIGMLGVGLAFGIGLFFMVPLFATKGLDSVIASGILVNFIEGVLRLAIFGVYIILIGMMRDIKRVFAYHGAEHMAVHAYEKGVDLHVESVRQYPTAHPRCGTAFLLVVMVVSIIIFTFLGRPSIEWLVVSRIVFIPLIAGVSYEIIRFSGTHSGHLLVRFVMIPSLALQSLTTRQPDNDQIEVAIAAMKQAVAADQGLLEKSGDVLADEKAMDEMGQGSISQEVIGGDGEA